jgi:putative transposase
LDLITKRAMIKQDKTISIESQCGILQISRSGFYYEPKPKLSSSDHKILNRMDEIYTESPQYGCRKYYNQLKREGYLIGFHRVRHFMKVLDLSVIYPKPKTSLKDKENSVYPYLLKNINIHKANQVWAGDITYIRLAEGFCYLVAIIDWYSRYILSWRLSNSLDTYFCLDALDEALRRYPNPVIFNSDQGSQYTSNDHTQKLKDNEIDISMDSVGRWADNIIIERFWRSLKVENIYPMAYESMGAVHDGCKNYISYYNEKRIHAGIKYRTPFEVYFGLN